MTNDNGSGTIELKPSGSENSTKKNSQQKLEQLKNVRKQSEDVLYEATTFSIFHPSTITIDREKVTVIQRRWWIFKRRFPILISDIKTVVSSRALIFGEVMFEITGYEKNPDIVRPFWPSQAHEIRSIVLGLVIAKNEGIDLSEFSREQLVGELEKIGKSHGK